MYESLFFFILLFGCICFFCWQLNKLVMIWVLCFLFVKCSVWCFRLAIFCELQKQNAQIQSQLKLHSFPRILSKGTSAWMTTQPRSARTFMHDFFYERYFKIYKFFRNFLPKNQNFQHKILPADHIKRKRTKKHEVTFQLFCITKNFFVKVTSCFWWFYHVIFDE